MPNTINSTGVLVTQETLRTLLIQYPMIKMLCRQFDAPVGQGVKIPKIMATSAGTWDATNGYAVTDRTVDTTDIDPGDWAIRHHTYRVTPMEATSTNPQIIARLSESGAHALGRSILDSLVALATVANVPSETIAATCDFDAIVAADKALANRGVPDPKFGLFNSTAWADLLSDDTIHSGLINTGATTIRTGQLSDIVGIPSARYAGMSTNSENLKGIVGGVDGFALVTGMPPEDASGAVSLSQVVDAQSGLQVLLREYVDQRSGATWRTVALGVATKIGEGEALQRIVSTDTESSSSES